MQVTLATSHLKKRLQLLTKVQAEGWPLQLDVANESVRLRGWSESARLALAVKAQHAIGDGVAHLPLAPFAKMVSQLTEQNVTITIEDGRAVMDSGSYRATLKCSWGEALPFDSSRRPIATIDLRSVQRVLEQVMFVTPVGNSFVAPVIKVESRQGALKAIATDGFRMVIASLPCQAEEFDLLVPLDAAIPLARLSGSWLEITETTGATPDLILTTDTEQIAVPAMTTFPPYENVLPQTEPLTMVELHRDALLKALNRLLPVVEDKAIPQIRFSVAENSDTVLLQSRSGREALPAKVKGAATSFIARADLLLPCVKRASGNVTIGSSGPDNVIDFKCHGGMFRFLQMPVKGPHA